MTDATEALLLIGVYGTGKTSVVEEMAAVLESHDVPFAAIDLDWLAWTNIPDGHGPRGHRLMLANLTAVVANDRAAGMTRFMLAGSINDADRLRTLRAALDMPLRVVRLVAPIEVIERRLSPNPTSGRADDLEQARHDLASRADEGLADRTVDSDRPLALVAGEILDWLGWR